MRNEKSLLYQNHSDPQYPTNLRKIKQQQQQQQQQEVSQSFCSLVQDKIEA
jgi:hypothetical protein